MGTTLRMQSISPKLTLVTNCTTIYTVLPVHQHCHTGALMGNFHSDLTVYIGITFVACGVAFMGQVFRISDIRVGHIADGRRIALVSNIMATLVLTSLMVLIYGRNYM